MLLYFFAFICQITVLSLKTTYFKNPIYFNYIKYSICLFNARSPNLLCILSLTYPIKVTRLMFDTFFPRYILNTF